MTYPGLEEDRSFILSSAVELDQYLSSDTLLWRLDGSNLPLTPGNLLFSRLRIGMNADDQVGSALQSIISTVENRRSAWEKKIRKEIPLRLNQWRNLVEELTRDGSLDASYSYNIRVRVILELITTELEYASPDVDQRLDELDCVLMNLSQPGRFIWDEELEKYLPQDRYPYLYVKECA